MYIDCIIMTSSIVPDMFHKDIQLYCPSLRAYHCGIWYLVTIFVDDLPHYIKETTSFPGVC